MSDLDKEVVRKALARLTGKQRKELLYRVRDKMTLQEIADEMGINVSAACKLVQRAKKKLIEGMQETT